LRLTNPVDKTFKLKLGIYIYINNYINIFFTMPALIPFVFLSFLMTPTPLFSNY
jgi:hypothetical protein